MDAFLQVLASLKLDAASDGVRVALGSGFVYGALTKAQVDVLRDRVAARIEDVESFQRTLSAGPLEAIVGKQAARLRAAREFLGNPSKPLPPEAIGSSNK